MNCFHKKSLLGLLETVSGREQWYCPICKKVYLKERRNLILRILDRLFND